MMEFLNHKILAKYKAGSDAFGFSGGDSDHDHVMILADYHGPNVIHDEGEDIFLYGLEDYKKRLDFSDELPDYFVIYNINTFHALDNIEVIDPGFEDEFKKIIQIDWASHLKEYLKRCIDYFSRYVEFKAMNKNLYHLYQIRGYLDNYAKKGVFGGDLSKATVAKINDFKANYRSMDESVLSVFQSILDSFGEYIAGGKGS